MEDFIQEEDIFEGANVVTTFEEFLEEKLAAWMREASGLVNEKRKSPSGKLFRIWGCRRARSGLYGRPEHVSDAVSRVSCITESAPRGRLNCWFRPTWNLVASLFVSSSYYLATPSTTRKSSEIRSSVGVRSLKKNERTVLVTSVIGSFFAANRQSDRWDAYLRERSHSIQHSSCHHVSIALYPVIS